MQRHVLIFINCSPCHITCQSKLSIKENKMRKTLVETVSSVNGTQEGHNIPPSFEVELDEKRRECSKFNAI